MKDQENIFNDGAANYDASFTHSSIGEFQRNRVYHWLESVHFFDKIDSVFELNCGTGYDAAKFLKKGLKVTATDGASAMIDFAIKNRSRDIEFYQLPFSKFNSRCINSNAVFSNFGGLNCLNTKELSALLKEIEEGQKSGDQLVMVIMPKFCFIEGIYLIAKLRWSQLFRRNKKSGVKINVDGAEVTTFYHSPKSIVKELSKYKITSKKPVAFFLPPSYLQPFFNRHPKLLFFLNKLEKVFGRFSFLSGWSDHFIIIAEKK